MSVYSVPIDMAQRSAITAFAAQSASHPREQNRKPQTEAIAEDLDAFERL